ncbi:MAG: HEAT repeat domain-containing protein [Methanimicrococcus sp.]|nr:HEAT repeat domain-containing protein [Methanimicrococcus sp.]
MEFVQSVQNPTSEDISFFISILADPNENEFLQTAVLLALKRCGDDAVQPLISLFFSEKSPDPASLASSSLGPASLGPASLGPASLGPASLGPASLGSASLGSASLGSASLGSASLGPASLDPAFKVRISYALSQIPKTPSSVFTEFLSDSHPRVRQNGVIGLSLQNEGEFDLLLFSVLQTDPDPKTAYEAAEALESGGDRTLPFFKTVILQDLKQNPYINSEKKSEAVNKIQREHTVSNVFNVINVSGKTEETLPAFSGRPADDHVLWKILEILGNTQNPELLPYIEPYLFHENPRIKNLAETMIQNFEK